MVDKAPELEDDFDNLTWLIVDMISTLEQKAEDQFNDGYNEGQADGYREASYEYGEDYERGYDEGHRDGFEEGFKDSVQTFKFNISTNIRGVKAPLKIHIKGVKVCQF